MTKNELQTEIKEVLELLRDKERQILISRFGLENEKRATLASIGKGLKLTRERIRQIQNAAILRLKNSCGKDKGIYPKILNFSRESGGVVSAETLKEKINSGYNQSLFFLETSKGLKRVKGNKSLIDVFVDNQTEAKDILEAEAGLKKMLKKKNKAQKVKILIKKYLLKNDRLPELALESLISVSSSFAFDWRNRVGLALWREVNPKSARDKAYYILRKEERPLHFVHISELISKEDFRGKNPTAATVHNELILDSRFVLVGRGIYALSEWGFRGGTVEQVIADLLRQNPKGLLRDVIIEEVLKSKLVARNTVMMNLLVKKQFIKNKEGLYKLAK